MTGFDCYRTYLAFKNHFTKDSFDYFRYGGKTKASVTAFNKRKDRYFFEKMSRQKKDGEIVDYFTAIFSQCDDPQKMWIGEIIESGDKNYADWQKKVQSLGYIFKQEMQSLCEGKEFNTLFDCKSGTHPPVVEEIQELQNSIQDSMMKYNFLNFWQQKEKLEELEELLEKQQLMYVRMKLSDDPNAKDIVKKMQMSLKDMGMPKDMTVEQMFQQMKLTISNVRRALDSRR